MSETELWFHNAPMQFVDGEPGSGLTITGDPDDSDVWPWLKADLEQR